MDTDYIGPPEDPKKYIIIKKVGDLSVYGTVYQTERISDGELFAVKVMRNKGKNTEEYWLDEINCLVDVMKICNQVGILCFEEAFIRRNNGIIEYIIVTPFLDGYISLQKFLDDNSSLSLDDAKKIYQQIVDVNNKMMETCGLNHGDLHYNNIMIDPDSKDVKVIDLGLCRTSKEMRKRYGSDMSYLDEYRINKLLDQLIQKVNQRTEEEMRNIKMKAPSNTCVRRRSVWKVRNSEEFEKQFNYLIKNISNNTDEDEIELLFNNLFDFIEVNQSLMGKEQKKSIPDIIKYKKLFGKTEPKNL